MNCKVWEFFPVEHPLSRPESWIQFALTAASAENKASDPDPKKRNLMAGLMKAAEAGNVGAMRETGRGGDGGDGAK